MTGTLVVRIETARLQLFKGAFAAHRCDALYQLMEFIAGQSERLLRMVE